MPADYNVFSKLKTFDDYQRADQEFQLKKQLAQAQIDKANELDVTKMGQAALVKASMGVPLTPQETAIAKVYDASTTGLQFDPATGAAVQKPSILSRLGVDAGTNNPQFAQQPAGLARGNPNAAQAPSAPQAAPVSGNQWDAEYKAQRAALAADPKAQHDLDVNFAKSKISMNEGEGKSATYADRMALDEATLNDPEKMAAYGSYTDRAIDFLNPFGNQGTSDAYKSYDQAQKDFSTAKLRQESGASINAGEFATDKQTLLPQPGDSKEVLAQKAANREAVRNGMVRQAGPAYKPTTITKPVELKRDAPKMGTVQDGYIYVGGDPAKPESWKVK